MINETLINLVDRLLKEKGNETSRGNRSYHCPKCNHQKRKLEVNFDDESIHYGSFGCWVCGFKSRDLYYLFKELNATQDKIDELNSLYKKNNKTRHTTSKPQIQLSLPNEFQPIIENDVINNIQAYKYLKSRGINEDDILKYNLGFCSKGIYKNMIIIPSYDFEGKLNYFTARSFEIGSKRKANPDVSRDVISFELFINWDIPLILCEGPFDAMAIKRNAIPLFGKFIQPNLMKKIVTSRVKKIYLALDKDALKKSLEVAEKLINEGKEVYLVELEDNQDPSELGFEKFTKLIQNTYPLNSYSLLEKKLSLYG